MDDEETKPGISISEHPLTTEERYEALDRQQQAVIRECIERGINTTCTFLGSGSYGTDIRNAQGEMRERNGLSRWLDADWGRVPNLYDKEYLKETGILELLSIRPFTEDVMGPVKTQGVVEKKGFLGKTKLVSGDITKQGVVGQRQVSSGEMIPGESDEPLYAINYGVPQNNLPPKLQFTTGGRLGAILSFNLAVPESTALKVSDIVAEDTTFPRKLAMATIQRTYEPRFVLETFKGNGIPPYHKWDEALPPSLLKLDSFKKNPNDSMGAEVVHFDVKRINGKRFGIPTKVTPANMPQKK